MEVEWGGEFEKAFVRAKKEAESGGNAELRYDQLLGLLRSLAKLETKPIQESPTFKRESGARSLRLRQGQVG